MRVCDLCGRELKSDPVVYEGKDVCEWCAKDRLGGKEVFILMTRGLDSHGEECSEYVRCIVPFPFPPTGYVVVNDNGRTEWVKKESV